MSGGRVLNIDDVQAIKHHLFFAEHVFERPGEARTVGRFGADPFQAGAWRRLEMGLGTLTDRLLLEHEFAEMTYLRENPGSGYFEAHSYANTDADWWTAFRKDPEWQ